MKQITDALIILNFSTNMFDNIKLLYDKCTYEEDLTPILKINIKNFLENIRSSLDYTANYLFDKYCISSYDQKELNKIKKKIYFPILDNSDKFNKSISNKFKGLPNDIISILEKYQPYNSNDWISNLVSIVNNNKHIELSKSIRTESGTIDYFEDMSGNIISNCYFENVTHAVVINGVPLSNNYANNPYVKSFSGNIQVDYYFSITNTHIIDTLDKILNGSKSLLNDLVNILQ